MHSSLVQSRCFRTTPSLIRCRLPALSTKIRWMVSKPVPALREFLQRWFKVAILLIWPRGCLKVSTWELTSKTVDIRISKIMIPSPARRPTSQRLRRPLKSSKVRSNRSAMSMCPVCLRKSDQSTTSETTISIWSQKIKTWRNLRLLMNLYNNNKIPLKIRKIKKRKIKTKVWHRANYNNCQILKLTPPPP